jgi:hypothetical protein
MARPKGSKNKPKNEPEVEAAKAAAAKPSEVRPAISAPKLKSLMKAKRTTATDTAEMNGRVGQMISEAVEKFHLHRKAFNTICQLDKMEPEKIRDYLDCFEHYLDISGIGKRAEGAPRLPLGDGEDSDGEEETEQDSNISRFPNQRAAE